jgi:nucleotide-binding universal stress UspA family protein
MAVRILVPFDGSPLSERALEYAIETHPDASITTMFVIDPIDSVFAVEAGGLPVSESWYDDERERARAIQSSAIEAAAGSDVELDTIIEVGQPARKILEYVDNRDVDHIVMGIHGRVGLERAILGSVADSVIRRAAVPVTIIR